MEATYSAYMLTLGVWQKTDSKLTVAQVRKIQALHANTPNRAEIRFVLEDNNI